jgi:hypothetical protein
MFWDGNGYNSDTDYTGVGSASNITASTTTGFFGYNWSAHDIQVFVPGTYSFDTKLTGENHESGILSATVPTGQIGMHMLFDWSSSANIDVFVVAETSAVFGPGIARSSSFNLSNFTFTCDGPPAGSGATINCLWDGNDLGSAGKPAGDQVWMLSSVDGNGDTIMGINMAPGGPFAGFNANFLANMDGTPKAVIPIPAAVWLFGSGLLGLVGIARRKKSA